MHWLIIKFKFYQFQNLPNLQLYKILNLEEITLHFHAQVFQLQGTKERSRVQHNLTGIDYPTIILISKVKLNKSATIDSRCKQNIPNM